MLAAAALAVVAIAVVIAVNGESDSPDASPVKLVGKAQLKSQPAGSAGRALLRYWSDMQFSDWPGALEEFSPSYLRTIGSDVTVAGMQIDGSLYPLVRPHIVGTSQRGSFATVRYLIQPPNGPVRRGSIAFARESTTAFARESTTWRIIYDSEMDRRFRATQQVASGASGTGKPGPKAIRAGEVAARAQAANLQFRLSRDKKQSRRAPNAAARSVSP